MNDIVLGPMQESDLPQVASLHREAMVYSLNARLGEKHLAYVYSVMAKDTGSLVVVARRVGTPVGAVSATLDPDHLKTEMMRRQTVAQWLRLCATVMRHPGVILEFIASSRLEAPVLLRGEPVKAYLSSIFVAPEIRGRGVGRALVFAVDEFFRGRGLPAYRLDTRADNAPARAFYRQLGFQEAERRGPNVVFVRDLTGEKG